MADQSTKRSQSLREGAAKAAFPIMGLLCVIAFAMCYPPDAPLGRWLVRLTVFLALAGFPSWLYVRFLSIKLTPIYHDFVLSLYRLGVDQPAYLPEPLESSGYHHSWQKACVATRDAGQRMLPVTREGVDADTETIYEKKFEAYFGRRDEHARFTGLGSLLPVIAVWIAFAVGWLAVLVNLNFVEGAVTLEDALRFGFMGAYLFSLQLTVRAFFQNDLRSGTYVGIFERLVVVLILVTVIHVAWSDLLPGGTAAAEAIVAFLVGSFPLVGQEWVTQTASSLMRHQVPSLRARHPLSEIDGMNVWYEARLLEEGIEDVQNLATASMVDLALHSRAPVGRLVDWVDQALLRQHLPTNEDREPSAVSTDTVLLETLEALGVRTATDLLELYSPLSRRSARELHHKLYPPQPEDSAQSGFHKEMLDIIPDPEIRRSVGLRMLAILRCLGSEPNLQLILNWQSGYGPVPYGVPNKSIEHTRIRPAYDDKVRAGRPLQDKMLTGL